MAATLGLGNVYIEVFVNELFILSFHGFEVLIEPSSLVTCSKP
jgi:hypothetical protein